jgi:hypothetical protein
MKHIALLIISIISLSLTSQNQIEKTVGQFNELKVYDLIDVELIKSNINKVIISGENKNEVVVNNKNGTLKIKMRLEEAFDGGQTQVQLYYTSLDIIDANEGAKIHSNDTIDQFEIKLSAQEGAKINANLKVTYATIRAVTGAQVSTSGTAKHQNISIYTGGVYNGKSLETQHSEISIRAAGEANVFAVEKVIAKVRAGGDINIYGNPKNVEQSKILGGRIKLIN